MSILKTNWATGDVVTADKLNAMQYAMVSITVDSGDLVINATAKELADALMDNVVVFASRRYVEGASGENVFGIVGKVSFDSNGYTFILSSFERASSSPVVGTEFFAEQDDEYPRGYPS